MKTFLTWLVLHCVLFAILIGGGHYWYSKSPHRILVAVDTSLGMKNSRTAARNLINNLDAVSGRYTEYALITPELHVHGWQKKIDPGNIFSSDSGFFGPAQFAVLNDEARYPIIEQSDERILVTNATSKPKGFGGWKLKTIE